MGRSEVQIAETSPAAITALARAHCATTATPVRSLGASPERRPNNGSRMRGDLHVRFCERPGVRFLRATHLVILIDAHPRQGWLLSVVEKRLREEFAALQVEINEEKSRTVDLSRSESFGFLGFDVRRVRSRRGHWRPSYTPKLKKRTALLRTLKDVFPPPPIA